MATRESEATEKADTGTNSNKSLLRTNAPRIRTPAAIVEKYEQIFDALDNDRVTGKVAEQLNQALKGITGVARLEIQYMSLVAKHGHKMPMPKSQILKGLIGARETAQREEPAG